MSLKLLSSWKCMYFVNVDINLNIIIFNQLYCIRSRVIDVAKEMTTLLLVVTCASI